VNRRPAVGIGVIVINPRDEILLGKRTGAHGEGEWSLPGGHLEWEESFKGCAAREVLEETGIDISGRHIEQITFTNDIFPKEDLHYVTLFLRTRLGYFVEAERKEPDKCLEWGWFSIYHLPQPLFLPLDNLLRKKNILTG